MKLILLHLLIMILISSCNNLTQREKELKDNLGKILNIDTFERIRHKDSYLSFQEFKQKFDYISVVYLQNGCDPCYPKYIDWQRNMDSISTPENHSVLFIIRSDSYNNFMKKVLAIDSVKNNYYSIIDSTFKFESTNREIPAWIINSPILINSENKIKMVGEPFSTPEMTKLFHETCKE